MPHEQIEDSYIEYKKCGILKNVPVRTSGGTTVEYQTRVIASPEIEALRAEVERLKEENKTLHSTAIVDAARVENAEGLVTELRAEVGRQNKVIYELRVEWERQQKATAEAQAEVERLQRNDVLAGRALEAKKDVLMNVEAERDRYKAALAKTGCNDLFCDESNRECKVCPAYLGRAEAVRP